MGLRGPPKTPTALNLVRGNPGNRAINRQEPKPTGSLGGPPAHLGKIGKALWRELAPQIRAMRLEARIDRKALESLCDAYEEHRVARAFVVENGFTYERRTAQGEVIHAKRPEVQVASDAQRRFIRLLQEFGFTPSARTRVKADAPAPKDEIEEFLKKGRRHG